VTPFEDVVDATDPVEKVVLLVLGLASFFKVLTLAWQAVGNNSEPQKL
jgi:hypothetical protein